MINQKNVEKLYQLILENDYSLQGCQWDELYTCDYDTPQSIINDFINIFLDTDFSEFDFNINDYVLIANREERKEALIKYFEKVVEELKTTKVKGGEYEDL